MSVYYQSLENQRSRKPVSSFITGHSPRFHISVIICVVVSAQIFFFLLMYNLLGSYPRHKGTRRKVDFNPQSVWGSRSVKWESGSGSWTKDETTRECWDHVNVPLLDVTYNMTPATFLDSYKNFCCSNFYSYHAAAVTACPCVADDLCEYMFTYLF